MVSEPFYLVLQEAWKDFYPTFLETQNTMRLKTPPTHPPGWRWSQKHKQGVGQDCLLALAGCGKLTGLHRYPFKKSPMGKDFRESHRPSFPCNSSLTAQSSLNGPVHYRFSQAFWAWISLAIHYSGQDLKEACGFGGLQKPSLILLNAAYKSRQTLLWLSFLPSDELVKATPKFSTVLLEAWTQHSWRKAHFHSP